jgi:hypothetical protein
MAISDKARLLLIGDAMRKGFQVISNEDNTGWLVVLPARPRRPSETRGEYASSDRAWMGACLIARDWET